METGMDQEQARPIRTRRKVIGAVLALGILGGAGIAYFYHAQGARFVRTEDARVAADMVLVIPQVAGRLREWTVEEGGRVEAGQVLGTVDPGLASGAVAGQGSAAPAVAADRLNIRAPSAGLVIRATAVAGATVAPGQPLAYLADPDRFYVAANIEETRIGRVRPGQVVDVRLDAYPDVVLEGRVRSVGLATASTFSLLPAQNVSGGFTKVTQRIPVKIDLPAAMGVRLMPGLSASVRIHTGR